MRFNRLVLRRLRSRRVRRTRRHGRCMLQRPPQTMRGAWRIRPACAPSQLTPPGDRSGRPYLLERVDDAAVVLVVRRWIRLAAAAAKKTLIWHLSLATLAGRDIFIFIDQKHRRRARNARCSSSRSWRTHRMSIAADARREIQRYTKLFWINNGPYNNLTARKFALNITPQALAAAAQAASAAGATFAMRQGELHRREAGAPGPDVLRSRTSIQS